MTAKKRPPSPGSDAARELGCSCPVIDNGRGKGYMGCVGIFVQNMDCKVHGVKKMVKKD